MNFEKMKTLSFLEFVPLCPLMLVKRSKNLLYIDTTEPHTAHQDPKSILSSPSQSSWTANQLFQASDQPSLNSNQPS